MYFELKTDDPKELERALLTIAGQAQPARVMLGNDGDYLTLTASVGETEGEPTSS